MKKTLINGKWEIVLPDHRADRPEWHTEKGWERERLDSMHANLSDKDTLFYIGAEEGDMCGLCAMWGAKLVMFEPNDKVWSNIKAIWDANNLPTPTVFSGFASNNTTSNALVINGFPPSADLPVIPDHGFKELCDAGDIPQVKIDDLVRESIKIGSPLIPTAMSIDVEGSEWQVLRGAEQTLREYRPKLWVSIHPEFMFRIYGEYQAELREWIRNLGYKEHFLDYQHEAHIYFEPILGQ